MGLCKGIVVLEMLSLGQKGTGLRWPAQQGLAGIWEPKARLQDKRRLK